MKNIYVKHAFWVVVLSLGIGGAGVLLARTYCYYVNETGEVARTDCEKKDRAEKARASYPVDISNAELPLLKGKVKDCLSYSCVYGEFTDGSVVLCKQVPADNTHNAVVSFLCAQACSAKDKKSCKCIGKLPDGRLCYHRQQ